MSNYDSDSGYDGALPASPTRCRPQHLDRERLRSALRAAQFADVCYHEAVVAATPAAPRSFQLLALATDCIYLFPLTSAHTAPPIRIALKRVVAIDVASPTLSGKRGLMLEPSCQLFHILVRARSDTRSHKSKSPKAKAPTIAAAAAAVAAAAGTPPIDAAPLVEYFVSTFEPDSRVFFYVSQAFETHFQKAVLQPPNTALKASSDSGDTGELSVLLDSLIRELVAEPRQLEKSRLLHELAIAGMCNRPLQNLFFADRTLFAAGTSSASHTGLTAMLVHELLELLAAREDTITSRTDSSSTDSDSSCELAADTLEYVASLLSVLVRMCFAGQLLPERLRFFLEAPVEDLVAALTRPVRRRRHRRHDTPTSRGRDECDDDECAAQLLVDEVIDLQVALLLELEALQQEANVVDGGRHLSRRAHHHIPQLALRSLTFGKWLGKLFKRICRSVARTDAELAAPLRVGSHWSLALWRNVKLLDMLWRAPSARVDVLTLLFASRIDYLNMYLRGSQSLEALSSSAVPHIHESGVRLQHFVDAALETM